VLPALTHIMAQHELRKGDGPIALILAPTHELAEQIVKEARRFAKPLGVRCTAVFGGVGKYEQFKELKAGAELLTLNLTLAQPLALALSQTLTLTLTLTLARRAPSSSWARRVG